MKKILNGLLVVVFLFAFLTVASRWFGYQYYAVISDSMHPSIPKFSLVYVKEIELHEAKNLSEGDVIAVKTSDRPLMHRIVSIDGETITMHGDHNGVDSTEEVAFSDVIGVVHLSIPVVGIFFLHELILPSIVLIVFIFIIIKEIRKEIIKNRR